MVGEFPELQGLMGGYYARHEGLGDVVSDAIRDHYKPVGPSDSVPAAPVGIAVALADKFDTLIGFFSINERPTGSRDPFALRRTALGIVRIILSNQVRMPMFKMLATSAYIISDQRRVSNRQSEFERASLELGRYADRETAFKLLFSVLEENRREEFLADDKTWNAISALSSAVLHFVAERLIISLKERGDRPDVVEAALLAGSSGKIDDDLSRVVDRIETLDAFLRTEDGANLLAGYKRATNILKAEEKKDGAPVSGEARSLPGAPDEETFLLAALRLALPDLKIELENEQFTEALGTLAQLRAPVDAFFEKVLVNADDAAVRQNRLRLLAQVRDAMGLVADFSLIAS